MEFSFSGEHVPAMPKRGTEKNPATLDAPRRALFDAVTSMGEDLATLSKQIGRNHAYLGQYLWRGTPRHLDEQDRAKLSTLLGVGEDTISHRPKPLVRPSTVDNHQSTVAPEKISALTFPPGAQTLHSWPKDLKIIGHVRAGVDGVFLDQGEIHGMAYRPPQLLGVPNAFAVYVHDESMVPAFKPGRIAWVHPTRPVAPGDDVVVELTDGQAFIKELVRRNEKHVICKQWNPLKEVRFDKVKVKRVYYVVGSYKED